MAFKYLRCVPSCITNSYQCILRYQGTHVHYKKCVLTRIIPENSGHHLSRFGQRRCFHTSARRNLGPVAWIIIRPLSKVGAIFIGRGVRKWWQSLPDKKRVYFMNCLKNNWPMVALASGTAVAGGYIYYDSHLSETPITHRQRYMAFTNEQILKVTQFEADRLLEEYEEHILPATHPLYKKVINVASRLTGSNQDIEQMKDKFWTVAIIENNEVNAFVLPTGHIFVHTGLIEFTNEDQLAIVLGHEMAHALLSHGAEQLSFTHLVDLTVIIVMAAIWAIMPSDGIAIVTNWFYNRVMQIMLKAPYSRKLEKEADKVGLQLAAKACFDVRQGTVFWQNMDVFDKLEGVRTPEWLSTHPSHGNRIELLEFLMERALLLRSECKCPSLPQRDPRLAASHLHKTVDDIMIGKLAGQNLKQVPKFKRR